MQLRSGSDTHFINAIMGGSVTKARSMNSPGEPTPVFKEIRSVYGGLRSCTSRLNSASELSKSKVNAENQDHPVVECRLLEADTPKDGALPCGTDGDKDRDLDDSTFGDMDITLKELKKICKKKRKRVSAHFLNHPQDQIKVEPVEDDLDEPLISLKVKVPKAKKRRMRSSTSSVLVRCESQDFEPARNLQLQVYLQPVQVKVEVLESESVPCPDVIYADYPVNRKGVLDVSEGLSPSLVDSQSMELNLCDQDYQSCSLNEVSTDDQENVEPLAVLNPSCEKIMDVEDQENLCQDLVLYPTLDYGKELQLSSPTKDESAGGNGCSLGCDLDEFSEQSTSNLAAVTPSIMAYDGSGETCHDGVSSADENAEPLAMIIPSCEEIMDVKDQEIVCQQLVLLPTSENGEELQSTNPIENESSDSNSYSLSCDLGEFSGHSTSNLTAVIPPRITYCSSGEETFHAEDFLPQCPSNTYEKSIPSEVDGSEERQQSECTTIDRVNNTLSNNETQPDVAEDGLSTFEEKQPAPAENVDAKNAERDSISCSQKFATGETSSSSVADQVPERLLSTRKVVSPTSEERLSLSMNSTGTCGDTDFLVCNEVLYNEEKIEARSSCEESKMHKSVSKRPEESPAVKRIKFTIGPSQIRKKTKAGRFSPPKGNMDGPRNARSLPKVNTGCTSVQGCSQNAVAFSQRQMQDIESLATKLMSELKSMKDMVEQKVLFESYRSLSSKHDADEVKNAITNATKTEEMAKKWLSIMGRDCNRFCKIMNQNSDSAVDSNKALSREKRKITFADEVGGSLCHVKFFETGTTSPERKEETKKMELDDAL